MRVIAVVTVAALVGCGDDLTAVSDGGSDGIDSSVLAPPCWPGPIRTTEASATLGTGREGFETMPQELPLEYGTQDGYNLVAHVRMSGMAPGNAANILDPMNPRTRIRAFFDDSNVPLNQASYCPFRNAYVPADGEGYDLLEAAPIIFDTCWRPSTLFGKRIRIELEIVDATGAYATDVKIVTAVAPTSFYPMEAPTQGCPYEPKTLEQ